MKWAKRVTLFLATNFLIIVTISLVLNLLGVWPYLSARGLDYQALLLFCLVWGMGGAFISLALSRVMAKWMMGVRLIDPRRADGAGRELLDIVYHLARSAGLKTMPEVGVYDSPEVNAFATGPTQNRALVAVSAGLLQRMDRDEIEGVLAHEIAHVANGDMVTMTLVQGVVNAFVMFLARVISFFASQAVREELQPAVRFAVTIALDILLGLLGLIVVSYFSRRREFRADYGGARLAGRGRMIAALERLRRNHERVDTGTAPALNTLKISGRPDGWMALFSTHPALEERIARLQQADLK
jgi:heat shock protein HtpX